VIEGKKIVVVMPAYNAERTLEQTYAEIPFDVVDEVVLVDDRSGDNTVAKAMALGIHHVVRHETNRGYGGNQKTCYRTALDAGADIVVMLHPDYQYTPKLIRSMCYLIAEGLFPVVLGSRILGGGALAGKMPRYKYVANRVLTLVQNLLMGQKLAEYHTGYRAFSAEILRQIPLEENSDDFVFDNQVLAQVCMAGHTIGEITCPTKYFEEASSIDFRRSCVYGAGVLITSCKYFLHRHALWKFRIFDFDAGRRLVPGPVRENGEIGSGRTSDSRIAEIRPDPISGQAGRAPSRRRPSSGPQAGSSR
jgi:glycosyltransferase involved in cell wall biosynthesis